MVTLQTLLDALHRAGLEAELLREQEERNDLGVVAKWVSLDIQQIVEVVREEIKKQYDPKGDAA